MPDAATVADHARTREAFVHALRCYRSRFSSTIELIANSHPTSVDEQHYDYVLYADEDIAERKLHDLIVKLWGNAGGRQPTLVPVEPGELRGVVGYLYKIWPKHQDRVLLCARNGLNQTWGTRFFKTVSAKRVRDELRAEWSNKLAVPYSPPDADEEDAGILGKLLPRSPDAAINIRTLARRAGLSVARTERLLVRVPDVAQTGSLTPEQERLWADGLWKSDYEQPVVVGGGLIATECRPDAGAGPICEAEWDRAHHHDHPYLPGTPDSVGGLIARTATVLGRDGELRPACRPTRRAARLDLVGRATRPVVEHNPHFRVMGRTCSSFGSTPIFFAQFVTSPWNTFFVTTFSRGWASSCLFRFMRPSASSSGCRSPPQSPRPRRRRSATCTWSSRLRHHTSSI
ncbi:hypothetical protein R5W23_005554 [Gemmata sp. JC673]|uniref:Uncharacterized protein n=1 Tax=Gemmata algarum TaxID=2975278 RepID=A0ABU5ETZ8_9BACT|nr:hypothetical protein [Gemmata algarum]MDY3558439.1 hypothetical protein [Gemmata algarum]